MNSTARTSIPMTEPLSIIAEVGVNHNGSIELAKELIRAAKRAGADAVKFQTFSADRLAARDTPKVPYQLKTSSKTESHHEMLKKLELSEAGHEELWRYCDEIGIEFISTPYGTAEAEFLQKLGVKTYKTASADIVDFDMHRFIAGTGIPSLIATGMATLADIESVLRIYDEAGTRDGVTLLHCVSAYPAPPESLNLDVIRTLRETFGVAVGYSDHAAGSTAAVIARCLGATCIEKHLTLDKSMPGPDHQASATPDELADLVAQTRQVSVMRGCSVKRVQPCEMDMRRVSRKSIVTARDLPAGHILTAADLDVRRPGTGMSPMLIPTIIGQRLRTPVAAGSMLSPNALAQVVD